MSKMDKSLCKLVKDEVQEKHPKLYVTLIDQPAYFCTKCGRAANVKANLCKPAKIGKEEERKFEQASVADEPALERQNDVEA